MIVRSKSELYIWCRMDRSGTTNTCQDPTGRSGVAQRGGNRIVGAPRSCDSDVTTAHYLILRKGSVACSLKFVGTLQLGVKYSAGTIPP
jgi:hypothetical protein